MHSKTVHIQQPDSVYHSGGHMNNNSSISIDQLRGSNDFILVGNDRQRNVRHRLRKKVQNFCSKKRFYKRVPVLAWLPKYNINSAIGDLIAGITVGLTLIPQGLAYASIAELPPQYGLYSSLLGCFIYIILGSCKDVSMGPTAISALLTAQAVNNKGPQHAVLLCFLTGIIQLLMGLLGLGFLIDFISGPVSSGFTSAVALIIVASQLKDVLGLKLTGNTFIEILESLVANIHKTNRWDAIFAVVCITILLLMRILTTVKVGPANTGTPRNQCHTYANMTFWLIGISRNAILVVVSGFIGYYFCQEGAPPFHVIGYVPPGLPTVQPPPFRSNETSFLDVVSDLGSGIVVVPLLGLLEDISVCKVFAHGKTVDATQELIAIGVSNLANSFVQAFPGTGALARSAVNNASGVKTTLGNLYTGTLVILALLFFTPYFYYIPKPTLAAIVISAAIFMVEVRVIKPMWRAKKSDLIPGIATFVSCLALPLQYGIVIGIVINVIFILYHAARPKISIEKLQSAGSTDYLLLTPDRCLIFPSVDYVRNVVNKYSIRQGIPVVIDCSHIYGADYTAASAIKTLMQDFLTRRQPLFFYNLKPSVSAVFDGLSPKEFVVYYNEGEIDEILKNWYDRRKHSVSTITK